MMVIIRMMIEMIDMVKSRFFARHKT